MRPFSRSNRAISCYFRYSPFLLSQNGEQLGVRPASKIYIDDNDGIAKLTLSPTRPLLKSRPGDTALRLSTIELLYAFRTERCRRGSQPQSQERDGLHDADPATAADPFSPHAFLPLIATLDRAVERFVGLHLIRRYPLIFGPWRERYDAEVALAAKIARAVVNITARSPNTQFRKKTRKLTKVAPRSRASIYEHN
ncbi:hypothetical protein C8Q73DRAFT_84452 [Cubamyces lactineus]|nr:hypothetical protein C8Q73DRAFT_84452 [Cubamyces lactineus]